jgi:hypothetical protein
VKNDLRQNSPEEKVISRSGINDVNYCQDVFIDNEMGQAIQSPYENENGVYY